MKPLIGFVTWNRMGHSVKNLLSLLECPDDFDLIIVDNGSEDDTVKFLKTLEDKRIIEKRYFDQNYGYCYAHNYCISKRMPGQDYISIDSDLCVKEHGFVDKFRRVLDKFPEIGLMGAVRQGYYVERNVTPKIHERNGIQFDKMPSIIGCCMYFPSKTLDVLGFLNEEVYLSDSEICYRVNKLKLWMGYVPNILVVNENPSCETCNNGGICSRTDLGCFKEYNRKYSHHEFIMNQKNFFDSYRHNFSEDQMYSGTLHVPSTLEKHNVNKILNNLKFFTRKNMITDLIESPLIIGGKGGSGTRVYVDIAKEMGFYKGPTNNYNDAPWVPWIHRYQIPYVDRWYGLGIPDKWHPKMEREIYPELKNYLKGHTETAVWKSPQNIHLLPFWHKTFPKMKFIHCVRDGRDMVYSANDYEFKQAADTNIFNSIEGSWEEKKINFWAKTNMMANKYGKKYLGHNYLLVRFEDLCGPDRYNEIIRIANFLNVDIFKNEMPPENFSGDGILEKCMKLVKPPASIGRYKDQITDEITKAGEKGLKHFGYL